MARTCEHCGKVSEKLVACEACGAQVCAEHKKEYGCDVCQGGQIKV